MIFLQNIAVLFLRGRLILNIEIVYKIIVVLDDFECPVSIIFSIL